MKSENEHYPQQKRIVFNAAGVNCQSRYNHLEGVGQNVEEKTMSKACLKMADYRHLWEQECHSKIKHNNRDSSSNTSIQTSDSFNSSLSQPITDEITLKMDAEDKLCSGPWQLSVSSDPASVSDVIDRKMSFESIDFKLPIPSIDDAPSLDDVFDVLDAEMDFFGPDMATEPPSTGSSPHFNDSPYQSYWSHGSCQPPHVYIPSSNPCNAFQGFNFGLAKGLQNPSRGLITAIRRLCELLSKPRSDHLDSIFVRLLNATLREMEAAAQPQSKSSRRRSARQDIPYRQRIRVNKSASDAEKGLGAANIRMSRSVACKSQSLPIISSRSRVARCTGTVDLTMLEGEKTSSEKTNTKAATQNEPFIALEDTMPVFMGSFI